MEVAPPIPRSALENDPRPGPLFEGNPVGEGTTRRGTATPVHRPQRPAGSIPGQGWASELENLPLSSSYLGRRVFVHGCSSKAQPLRLTLDEGYLLTTALPDLQRGSQDALPLATRMET